MTLRAHVALAAPAAGLLAAAALGAPAAQALALAAVGWSAIVSVATRLSGPAPRRRADAVAPRVPQAPARSIAAPAHNGSRVRRGSLLRDPRGRARSSAR